MLKFFGYVASLGFALFLAGGCKSASLEKGSDFVAIEKLFSDALLFDGQAICSSGFAKIGEGISVYPDKYDNIPNPYEIAVLLDFRNAQRPKPYTLKADQHIRFCGVIIIDKDCWQKPNPNISGPYCVPFNKPIDMQVQTLHF